MSKLPKPKGAKVARPSAHALDQSSLKQLDELIEARLIEAEEIEDRAAIALVALLNGDPLPMADRLEAGDEIDDADRRYLARWLRGEIKRARKRPKDPRRLTRVFKAARMARRLRRADEQEDPVTMALAEYFGVSQGTIREWLSEWRESRIPDKS